jgi:hypothetical protein
MNILPINLATSAIHIDLRQLEESLALPQVACDPEGQNDGDSQHDAEPALGVVDASADRCDGNEELGGEDDDDQEEADPGTPDTKDGLVGDLVDGVALGFPGGAEADVRLLRVSACSVWRSRSVKLTTQIEPHVRSAAREDMANSHPKTVEPSGAI